MKLQQEVITAAGGALYIEQAHILIMYVPVM